MSQSTLRNRLSKVKQTLCRPGQALSVPEGWVSQISRQSKHEGDKFVNLTHWPPLPQEMFLVLISVDTRVIVRTEELCQLKFPMAHSKIEPASFRLIEQFHLPYVLFGNNFVPARITKDGCYKANIDRSTAEFCV
jgi:hypothetical protein